MDDKTFVRSWQFVTLRGEDLLTIFPVNVGVDFVNSTILDSMEMSTMKEAIVRPDLTVELHTVPIPKPTSTQVLIKVVCAGCNPKDWKQPVFSKTSLNSGDDMAGIVESVGSDVLEFKIGDRVAAFHTMQEPGGAYAEYGLAESWTTFHLPDNVSFEEAATIPLAGLTAAIALFWRLNLPLPWQRSSQIRPLIIYGASTAVGAFTIKLARHSNIHPIIAIAGAGGTYVETLIDRSKGDTVVDYRKGVNWVVQSARDAVRGAGGLSILHAIDAICEGGSYLTVSQILSDGGNLTLLNPNLQNLDLPTSLNVTTTYVGLLNGHMNRDRWLRDQDQKGLATCRQEFGLVASRLFTTGLRDGWLVGHPYEVVPGGLNAVGKGLSALKDGSVSARKLVYKVEET